MRVMAGKVVAGKVVFKESAVADGTDVWVIAADAVVDTELSAAELAELGAGISEADRGETIDGSEWLAQLRRRN